MKPIRSARHALMFFGAGAVTAYFLDPAAGPDRREKLMQQVRSLSGSAGQMSSSPTAGPPIFESSRDQERPSTSTAHDESGAIDLATGRPVSESPAPQRSS